MAETSSTGVLFSKSASAAPSVKPRSCYSLIPALAPTTGLALTLPAGLALILPPSLNKLPAAAARQQDFGKGISKIHSSWAVLPATLCRSHPRQ